MKSLIFASTGALALAGGYSAMDHTPVYAVGIDQAYSRLHATRFSDELGSVSMRKSAVSESVTGEPGQSLRWSLRMDGVLLGQIEAQLKPNGASSTKVAVAFKASETGPLRKLAQFVQDDGLLSAGLQAMLDERVAASLEKRKFDGRKVEQAFAHYAMLHPWEVTSLQVKLQNLRADPTAAKDLFGEATDEARARNELARTRPGMPTVSPEDHLRQQQREAERRMREASAPAIDLETDR